MRVLFGRISDDVVAGDIPDDKFKTPLLASAIVFVLIDVPHRENPSVGDELPKP